MPGSHGRRKRLQLPAPYALRPMLYAAVLAAAGTAAPARFPSDIPQTTLARGDVKLTILLPDAAKGYYRGTRFDWSGMVGEAEYRGHTFFGEWRFPHNPTNHDDVTGPAEEFGIRTGALGWSEAQPGEGVVKIGVGELKKDDEPRYSPFRTLEILRPAPWRVTSGRDWIEFRQALAGPRGWGYEWTKRISLTRDGFTIDHRLKNTGTKTIETDWYNHNFVRIDDTPVGTAYRLEWGFPAEADRSLKEIADLRSGVMTFRRDMEPRESLFAELKGFGPERAHNAVTLRNLRTGAALRITGDHAPARYNFYAERTAACPEPFLMLRLAPGDERRWKSEYRFIIGKKGGADGDAR